MPPARASTSSHAWRCTPASGFAAVGTRLFFFADDGTHTFTLHASDGRAPATTPLTPVTPLLGSHGIVDLDGRALVRDYGRLLLSDGTLQGTSPVVETSGRIGNLVVVGALAFFTVHDDGDPMLWTTDGTPSGSRPVPGLPQTAFLAPVGTRHGELFVTVGTKVPELWRTDGTTSTRVTALQPGQSGESGATVGRLVFFVLQDTVNGNRSIWRTDGTETGTVQVPREEDARGTLAAPRNLRALGNLLVFTSFTGARASRGRCGACVRGSRWRAAGDRRPRYTAPRGSSRRTGSRSPVAAAASGRTTSGRRVTAAARA